MQDNYQFPPISNTSAIAPFPLSPKRKKKVEKTTVDRVQTLTWDGYSKITSFSSYALIQFFHQEELLKRSTTTYSKSHYFAHVKQLESPSYPGLIKERFKEKTTSVTSSKLLFEAQFQLKRDGILKKTPDGLVYLHISDDYIHKLYPLLDEEGTQKPSYCAHIPIISEKELSTLNLEQLKEFGEVFDFTIKNCQCIHSSEHSDVESIWVLNVESPSLEHLRERYGLSSKLHSQEFAIVIGIKPRETPIQSKEQDSYYFRINPAISYA